MREDRRRFLKTLGALGAGCILPHGAPASASSATHGADPEAIGVLADLTYCVGCRKCEWACQNTHDQVDAPIESYRNAAEFEEQRRPDARTRTVVNAFPPESGETPVYGKAQCMHCVEPACVSACIVGALTKEAKGPVRYDATRCMGCRYCMVACPFQIPAYEYEEALAPRVIKCSICEKRTAEVGVRPACVEICPEGCLIYGNREELLEYARKRAEEKPERYRNGIFGEHVVGGTSWLYLLPRLPGEMGFPELSDASLPPLTEKVQHGIFKNFFPPLALFGILGGIMWLNGREEE